jgi:cytochrome c553
MIISAALLVAGAVSVGAADAKANWDAKCKVCHGPDGKGKTKMGEKVGIKDYSDAKVQEAMKDDEMAKAIKDGVKDGVKTKMKALAMC